MAAKVIKMERYREKYESQTKVIFQDEFKVHAIEIRINTSPIRLVRAVIIPAARDLGF